MFIPIEILRQMGFLDYILAAISFRIAVMAFRMIF